MRWLCDEMLGGLARLLRAAGHDVLTAPRGAPDAELVAIAREQDRLLATRDGDLARQAGARGLRLRAGAALQQARELSAAVEVDWLAAPFTRCLVDNSPLRPATAGEVARMPGDTASLPGPFNACPACGRIYWPGSHVKRLRRTLTDLARSRDRPAGNPPPSTATTSP